MQCVNKQKAYCKTFARWSVRTKYIIPRKHAELNMSVILWWHPNLWVLLLTYKIYYFIWSDFFYINFRIFYRDTSLYIMPLFGKKCSFCGFKCPFRNHWPPVVCTGPWHWHWTVLLVVTASQWQALDCENKLTIGVWIRWFFNCVTTFYYLKNYRITN